MQNAVPNGEGGMLAILGSKIQDINILPKIITTNFSVMLQMITR